MLQILIVILVLGIFPLLIGSLIENRLFPMYLIGFTSMLCIFYVLCLPMLFLQVRFTNLCILYWIVIIILCIVAILKKKIQQIIKEVMKLVASMDNLNIYLVAAMFFIAFQIARIIVKTPYIYGDDVTYLSMVNDILSSDIIHGLKTTTGSEIALYSVSHKYLFTAYYPFLACLAKITMLHPLILCKSVLIIFYMPMSYMIIWMLGRKLLGGDVEKRSIFFLIYVVLVEFGNFSYYTISRRMLIWSWNSKSVLFTILLPLLFYYGIQFIDHRVEKKELFIGLLLQGAAVATTLMGAGMAPIMLVTMSFVGSVKNHKPKILLQGLVCCLPAVFIMIIDVIYRMGIRI